MARPSPERGPSPWRLVRLALFVALFVAMLVREGASQRAAAVAMMVAVAPVVVYDVALPLLRSGRGSKRPRA